MNVNKIPLITLLIENTVHALSKDQRFNSAELKDIENLKVNLEFWQSKKIMKK